MKRLTLPAVLVLLLVLVSCEDQVLQPEVPARTDDPALSASPQEMAKSGQVSTFTAPLSGDQEVPSVETDARGVAHFKLSKDGSSLSYRLRVANIENVLMAHIHLAAADQNGPVVVWLYPEDGPPPALIEGRFDGPLAEGTITGDDLVGPLAGEELESLLEEMANGHAYVNVHTSQQPAGEIRGQITRGSGVVLPPSSDDALLSQQLNRVRQLTKQYRDIETAREEEYAAVSPYVPGMGFHFADGSPFGTELENPGVLVYATNGSYNPAPGEFHDPARDDELILVAVEWLVPGNQAEAPPNLFNDEDSPRRLKITEEEGWHFEEEEGFTGLHAWIHRGNPAGVFHHTNPTID